MRVEKRKCTMQTMGTVLSATSMGEGRPTMITVRYQIRGNVYEVTETVQMRSEFKKLAGFLPIGRKKVPIMGNTAVGSMVRVMYNPKNPVEAYLSDNGHRRR